MPSVRTPLLPKPQDAPRDGSVHPGVIVTLLASAGVFLTVGLALASEGHLPAALRALISCLSTYSAKVGLGLRHAAVAEMLLGAGGCIGTVAVGLGCQRLYSRTVLKPSSTGSPASPSHHGVSNRVGGLIKALGSAEERQRLRNAEALEQDAVVKSTAVEEGASPMVPPVERTDASSWRIHGLYEHQLLKAGLQHLDAAWPREGLLDFSCGRGGKGSRNILRKKLLTDLVTGQIHLRSVPANDLAAAQGDVRLLSLMQLLRLRVLHIDFTPSGTGADTVSDVGATHAAFLSLLDRLLFEQLGKKASAGASDEVLEASEAHRLGREAALMVAAAAGLPSPSWWYWRMSAERRVFFHAKHFCSTKDLPSDTAGAGVLEITADRSRKDAHEPTGRLRWLDWTIELVTTKAELSSAEPSLHEDVDCSSTGAASGKDVTAGGAAAMAISVEALCQAKRGLRPTCTLALQ